ncbi:MAG: hypothetical protein FJZ47_06485 [Candidatus Tectomicrobia bacterium]|uniref:Glucosamine inositolphosphorylceramide transferase 1 N-terminal domain-containing protein n=1 Tax=Tectimicrobiota bacterium TaxID=2528274 RepID=A0A937W0D4_UNCTE|nr:hypothetical protein [Candidatus Tectomicrobia bacterium]
MEASGVAVVPQDIWSIGLYSGDSPLTMTPADGIVNPVLTAAHVTDIPATFVADPFLLHVEPTWYMFFEVMHMVWQRGVIGLATSADRYHWQYAGVVLQEDFHLSYPYVFAWQGAYYMVPETLEAHAIRVYRAVDFPITWACVAEVLAGQYADPSLVQADGLWWMFVCSTPFEHDTLCLYYADTLLGPWRAHPQNPLIQGDAHTARPGGRVTWFGDRLIRYAQDDAPFYGKQVRAFEITTLTTTQYGERELPASPVLQPSGAGWNAKGMHHIDPHRLNAAHWFASVDGHYEERPDS